MQILILLILLCCIICQKNRFFDEICIFDISPKIIICWRNNLTIRGFLPWKFRRKTNQLVFKQRRIDRSFSSQHSAAPTETRKKAVSKPGTSLVSYLSANVVTKLKPPLKMKHFIWYGCRLNVNFKRENRFSVFFGIFEKNHKNPTNVTPAQFDYRYIHLSNGLKALRWRNQPAVMEHDENRSFFSNPTPVSKSCRPRRSFLKSAYLMLSHARPIYMTAFSTLSSMESVNISLHDMLQHEQFLSSYRNVAQPH